MGHITGTATEIPATRVFVQQYGEIGWRLLLESALQLEDMPPNKREFYEDFLDDLARALGTDPGKGD